eukprot:403358601
MAALFNYLMKNQTSHYASSSSLSQATDTFESKIMSCLIFILLQTSVFKGTQFKKENQMVSDLRQIRVAQQIYDQIWILTRGNNMHKMIIRNDNRSIPRAKDKKTMGQMQNLQTIPSQVLITEGSMKSPIRTDQTNQNQVLNQIFFNPKNQTSPNQMMKSLSPNRQQLSCSRQQNPSPINFINSQTSSITNSPQTSNQGKEQYREERMFNQKSKKPSKDLKRIQEILKPQYQQFQKLNQLMSLSFSNQKLLKSNQNLQGYNSQRNQSLSNRTSTINNNPSVSNFSKYLNQTNTNQTAMNLQSFQNCSRNMSQTSRNNFQDTKTLTSYNKSFKNMTSNMTQSINSQKRGRLLNGQSFQSLQSQQQTSNRQMNARSQCSQRSRQMGVHYRLLEKGEDYRQKKEKMIVEKELQNERDLQQLQGQMHKLPIENIRSAQNFYEQMVEYKTRVQDRAKETLDRKQSQEKEKFKLQLQTNNKNVKSKYLSSSMSRNQTQGFNNTQHQSHSIKAEQNNQVQVDDGQIFMIPDNYNEYVLLQQKQEGFQMENQKQAKEKILQQQCTFKPKITRQAQNLQRANSIENILYQDAVIRQKKNKAQQNKKCDKNPQSFTNNQSKQILREKALANFEKVHKEIVDIKEPDLSQDLENLTHPLGLDFLQVLEILQKLELINAKDQIATKSLETLYDLSNKSKRLCKKVLRNIMLYIQNLSEFKEVVDFSKDQIELLKKLRKMSIQSMKSKFLTQKQSQDKENRQDIQYFKKQNSLNDFQPKINQNAKNLIQDESLLLMPVQERLLYQSQLAQQRRVIKQNIKFYQELDNCTFEPQISKNSQLINQFKQQYQVGIHNSQINDGSLINATHSKEIQPKDSQAFRSTNHQYKNSSTSINTQNTNSTTGQTITVSAIQNQQNILNEVLNVNQAFTLSQKLHQIFQQEKMALQENKSSMKNSINLVNGNSQIIEGKSSDIKLKQNQSTSIQSQEQQQKVEIKQDLIVQSKKLQLQSQNTSKPTLEMQKNQNKLILHLNLAFGQDDYENIDIYERDDIQIVVDEICQKRKISDLSLIKKIKKHIIDQIQN